MVEGSLSESTSGNARGYRGFVRGFFGIALWQPKFIENYGSICRSGRAFSTDLIYLIGDRYRGNQGDTTKSYRHIPTFRIPTLEEFLNLIPISTTLVRVEVDGEYELSQFSHPERAIYIFGGEDRSLPEIPNSISLRINTKVCVNQALAAGLVMYDRQVKRSHGI